MRTPSARRSSSTHLAQLEAESIHIIREAVAECDNPVMLYSIGKDSSVLLHLALKAFYPAKPPFPLLHVDTTWKFREMIAFRDRRVQELGLDLIVHINRGRPRARHHADHARLGAAHRRDEDAGAAAGARPARLRCRLRRRAPRRGEARAPRSASSRCATRSIAGTPSASARSRGGSTTAASARARACACSRCPTGPSSTSGSTSTRREFRSFRSISRRRARSSSATAR